jgi:hypothetical protein
MASMLMLTVPVIVVVLLLASVIVFAFVCHSSFSDSINFFTFLPYHTLLVQGVSLGFPLTLCVPKLFMVV